jgi:hypothetical protein
MTISASARPEPAAIQAANDNTPRWPFQEMHSRGELGVSEVENRRHWREGKRFKEIYDAAHGDVQEDSAAANWVSLVQPFLRPEGAVVPIEDGDQGISLSDDGEFEDGGTLPAFEVVDCASFNVFRDLPPAALTTQYKQVVALAADVLGGHYPVLVHLLTKGWTAQMLGETEGFVDRASASACGKGMLRAALRQLSTFFMKLDRLEQEGEPTQCAWRLVGTPAWQFVDVPDVRWKRGSKAWMPGDETSVGEVLIFTSEGVSTPAKPDEV